MGMSTYAYGFIPPDGEHAKMASVWHACVEAGVDIPDVVEDYFECVAPDPRGKQVELGKAVSDWQSDMQRGIEIDITKLDPAITTIRFVNSW